MLRHPYGHRFTMVLGILGLFAVFSLVVMLLWNAVMPGLLGAGSMDYPHAAGLLLLCRILFGGLGHGFWARGMYGRFREHPGHLHAMTPEQREAFARRMNDRFPGFAGFMDLGRAGERQDGGNEDAPRGNA